MLDFPFGFQLTAALHKEGGYVVAAAAAAEALVRAVGARLCGSDLRAARNEDQLVAHTHFGCDAVDLGDVLIVDVIVADDGGGEHRIRIELDRRVHELLRRDGSAEIMHLNAVFFDAAVLDVDDFAQTDGMFVFADRAEFHRRS